MIPHVSGVGAGGDKRSSTYRRPINQRPINVLFGLSWFVLYLACFQCCV